VKQERDVANVEVSRASDSTSSLIKSPIAYFAVIPTMRSEADRRTKARSSVRLSPAPNSLRPRLRRMAGEIFLFSR